MVTREYSSYIGIPYEQLDCFHLAKMFYWEQFNVRLKHYYEETPNDRHEMKNLIYSNMGDFVQVEYPEFGDLILFRIFGVESHIAIYLGEGMFLHSIKGVGSCMEKLERWNRHVSGYYRLKELK